MIKPSLPDWFPLQYFLKCWFTLKGTVFQAIPLNTILSWQKMQALLTEKHRNLHKAGCFQYGEVGMLLLCDMAMKALILPFGIISA